MYIPLLAPTPYRILFNVLTDGEDKILHIESKGTALQWSVGDGPVTQSLFDPEMRTVTVRVINVPGTYKAKSVMDNHPEIRELTTGYPIFHGLLNGIQRATQEPYFDIKTLRSSTERFLEAVDVFQEVQTNGPTEIKVNVPEKGSWSYRVFHAGNTEPNEVVMKPGEMLLTIMPDQIVGIRGGTALYLIKHSHVSGHLYAAVLNSKKTQQLVKQKNVHIVPITLGQ